MRCTPHCERQPSKAKKLQSVDNKFKNKVESVLIALIMTLGGLLSVSSLAWMFFGMRKFIASGETGGLFAVAVGIVCIAGGVTVLYLGQSAKSFISQGNSLTDWANSKLHYLNIPGAVTVCFFAIIWMLFICGMGLLLLSDKFDQELISTSALFFLFISIGVALAGISTFWFRILVTRHSG